MFTTLLDGLDHIAGKTITADALLTQRKIAQYLVEKRKAHYLFTVKGNQGTLLADIQRGFDDRGEADYSEPPSLAHGRIECRKIWTTTQLNEYLDFPSVGQVFAIERTRVNKKTGHDSSTIVYGVTDHSPATADAERLLMMNREHWCIENKCHYTIDWNWDEDRNVIRSNYGPENTTRLRRFAVSIIKAMSTRSVAASIRKLARNVRLVFDYLRMTENSQRPFVKKNEQLA